MNKRQRREHNEHAASFPRPGGRGELNPASKLTTEVVRLIRGSKASTRELAEVLKVSQSTVVRARQGLTWNDA